MHMLSMWAMGTGGAHADVSYSNSSSCFGEIFSSHICNGFTPILNICRITQGSIKFSHCAPTTSYGNVGHGQHWLRLWLVVWWHQAITWTDIDFSLTRFTTFTCDQLNSDNEFENHNCEITTTSRRGTKFKCINANQVLTVIYRLLSLCDMFALASLVWLHGDISNEHEGSELFTASTAFVWRRSRQVSMKVKWNYVFVAYHYLIVYYHVVFYHMVSLSYHISYHIIPIHIISHHVWDPNLVIPVPLDVLAPIGATLSTTSRHSDECKLRCVLPRFSSHHNVIYSLVQLTIFQHWFK